MELGLLFGYSFLCYLYFGITGEKTNFNLFFGFFSFYNFSKIFVEINLLSVN